MDELRTYVALVRAINVGGTGLLKMSELRSALEKTGFSDVVTYIQTGNIVLCSAELEPDEIARSVEQVILAANGQNTAVFVLTPEELESAAHNNPFRPEPGSDTQSQIMLLSGEPEREARERLADLEKPEYRFAVRGPVFYCAYSKEWAGKRRSLDFEKILGVRGTSRTWKVVDRLIGLAAGR